jgi:hypothetical protein
MTPATGMNKAELFKAKGAEILKPHNMEDFIKVPQVPQIHKTTNTPNHITAPNQDKSQSKKITDNRERLGRLHIQIRQDLIDRLLEEVFKRKRTPKMKKRTASQRAIIEEALDQYFKNNKVENDSDPSADKTPL